MLHIELGKQRIRAHIDPSDQISEARILDGSGTVVIDVVEEYSGEKLTLFLHPNSWQDMVEKVEAAKKAEADEKARRKQLNL